MRHRGITVIEVMREMGFETNKHVTWAVGDRMRREFVDEYGKQPPKDNRTKTSGGGSHCFAIYPPHWRERIAAVVEEVGAARAKQGNLF